MFSQMWRMLAMLSDSEWEVVARRVVVEARAVWVNAAVGGVGGMGVEVDHAYQGRFPYVVK
jgi:hypothetical protein